MPCAKFCVNWSRNVGGVGKNQFSGFRDLAKNIQDENGRGLDQKMQQTPVHLCVQVFGLWEVWCGSYSPKRVFLGIAPPRDRRVWILSSAVTSRTWI